MGIVVAMEHEYRASDRGECRRLHPFRLQAQHIAPGLLVALPVHPHGVASLRQGVVGLGLLHEAAKSGQQPVSLGATGPGHPPL